MVQAELPITAHADVLVRAISENPVVVVIGETGSGKTTQLSQVFEVLTKNALLCSRSGRAVVTLLHAAPVQGRLRCEGGHSSDPATARGKPTA